MNDKGSFSPQPSPLSPTFSSFPVLVLDDEPLALRVAEIMLQAAGIKPVITLSDSRELMSRLAKQPVAVLLLDLTMPHLTGEELLPEVTAKYPDLPVVVCTGANDVETAVHCMQAGAFDYIVKPFEENRLIPSVRRALEMRELRQEFTSFKDRVLSDQLEHPEAFAEIVSVSPKMRSLFQYTESIAHTSRPILITGETGCGKELLAQAIHNVSGLTGEFVAVNAAGLDDALFTDALFGHRKGAFTGADEARAGLIARAEGGTIFLDEIGDLAPASQVKLLRLLQERAYMPLGADVPKPSTARVLAATNCDLATLMREGKFRNDLYYRLQTHHLHLPPLRERREDLPVLLDCFLEKAAIALDKKKPTPPRELLSLLGSYAFPGNIRELESLVFDAVSRHESHTLSMERFRERILGADATNPPFSEVQTDNPFVHCEPLPTIKESYQLLIEETMRRCNQNQSLAARLLGISQPGLSKALKREV